MQNIKTSDLLVNSNGAIYHLALKQDQIPTNIITVGDPKRVEVVGEMFDRILSKTSNREYHTIIGEAADKPIMVISSGMGCGAIDIMVNELDALVNVDLSTMQPRSSHTKLNIVRIGTCGAISNQIELGDAILSNYTIGIDSLANFYKETDAIDCVELSELFRKEIFSDSKYVVPYSIEGSKELIDKFGKFTRSGITMCAGGFFAPQGRRIRLTPRFDDIIDRLSRFSYNGLELTNIEMESAPLQALATSLGHNAITVALAVAHRSKEDININYNKRMKTLIESVIETI